MNDSEELNQDGKVQSQLVTFAVVISMSLGLSYLLAVAVKKAKADIRASVNQGRIADAVERLASDYELVHGIRR